MKEFGELILGIVMTVIGAFIFMSNVIVDGIYGGFYNIGHTGMLHMGTSTCGVLVICMAISLFAVVVKPNRVTKTFLVSLFILFIVAVILSLRFSFKTITGATLFMIIGLFVIGLGLVTRVLLFGEKKEK